MEYSDFIILLICGIISGFINTVAGGGSFLTLPILIFMDLPVSIANGTNRVQIVMQNIFAVSGFKSRGLSEFKFSGWLSLSAIIGSIIGAKIAIDFPEDAFKKILSLIMIIVVMSIFLKKNQSINQLNQKLIKNKLVSVLLFFFVGIYGGFIHAGVGFIMIAILAHINSLKLSKANSIKVFVVLMYTIFALMIFIYEGKVHWIYGISIGLGSGLGGWIASRWSYNKSDRIIKILLGITVGIMSIRLWFF